MNEHEVVRGDGELSRASDRDPKSGPLRRELGYRRIIADDAVRAMGSGAVDISRFPGRLIAIEGTDYAGRSTQIALLREWLETEGFGVLHTGLTRSRLAGEGLRRAKQGTTLGQLTLNLFYATDFADRLENEILPALRAGFVVLTDRYIYSIMVRSMVRGVDGDWLRDLYSFAPRPHGVLYLKIAIPSLIPRALMKGGFDYWESGLDFQEESDFFQSFIRYQGRLLSAFDDISQMYEFQLVDANRSMDAIFKDLRDGVWNLVSNMRNKRT